MDPTLFQRGIPKLPIKACEGLFLGQTNIVHCRTHYPNHLPHPYCPYMKMRFVCLSIPLDTLNTRKVKATNDSFIYGTYTIPYIFIFKIYVVHLVKVMGKDHQHQIHGDRELVNKGLDPFLFG